MTAPYFAMMTNGPGTLVFPDHSDLEGFAASTAAVVSSLLMVISESKADDVWIAQTIAHCHSLAYQVQQATVALRDGPNKHQVDSWQRMVGYSEDTEPLPAIGNSPAENFSAGQALAAAILDEAESFGHADKSHEIQRKFRDGAPQNRFAKSYLQQLIDQPHLLEGFAAVLSGALGQALNADWTCAEYFALRPLAEFEQGLPGEDGTEPDDSFEPIPDPPRAMATRRSKKAVPA